MSHPPSQRDSPPLSTGVATISPLRGNREGPRRLSPKPLPHSAPPDSPVGMSRHPDGGRKKWQFGTLGGNPLFTMRPTSCSCRIANSVEVMLSPFLNSRLKCNTYSLCKDFGRGPIGEAFPGTMIQCVHDRRKPARRNPGKVRLFREIITQESVGILIRPTLPRRDRGWQSRPGSPTSVGACEMPSIHSHYPRSASASPAAGAAAEVFAWRP